MPSTAFPNSVSLQAQACTKLWSGEWSAPCSLFIEAMDHSSADLDLADHGYGSDSDDAHRFAGAQGRSWVQAQAMKDWLPPPPAPPPSWNQATQITPRAMVAAAARATSPMSARSFADTLPSLTSVTDAAVIVVRQSAERMLVDDTPASQPPQASQPLHVAGDGGGPAAASSLGMHLPALLDDPLIAQRLRSAGISAADGLDILISGLADSSSVHDLIRSWALSFLEQRLEDAKGAVEFESVGAYPMDDAMRSILYEPQSDHAERAEVDDATPRFSVEGVAQSRNAVQARGAGFAPSADLDCEERSVADVEAETASEAYSEDFADDMHSRLEEADIHSSLGAAALAGNGDVGIDQTDAGIDQTAHATATPGLDLASRSHEPVHDFDAVAESSARQSDSAFEPALGLHAMRSAPREGVVDGTPSAWHERASVSMGGCSASAAAVEPTESSSCVPSVVDAWLHELVMALGTATEGEDVDSSSSAGDRSTVAATLSMRNARSEVALAEVLAEAHAGPCSVSECKPSVGESSYDSPASEPRIGAADYVQGAKLYVEGAESMEREDLSAGSGRQESRHDHPQLLERFEDRARGDLEWGYDGYEHFDPVDAASGDESDECDEPGLGMYPLGSHVDEFRGIPGGARGLTVEEELSQLFDEGSVSLSAGAYPTWL
jgi:hypothetical protein